MHEILFTGGLVSKKRAVDFYKKGISELEIGLQISCDEEGMYSISIVCTCTLHQCIWLYACIFMICVHFEHTLARII